MKCKATKNKCAVYGKATLTLVKQKHLVTLIGYGRQTLAGDVTQLVTAVTEGEQQVALLIVSKDLASLLVDDRPSLLRTRGNVHNGGCAIDGIRGLELLVIHLTGGRIEAVTAHDLGTGGVEHLNGSVGTGLALRLDGTEHLLLGNGRGRYVNELVYQCNVVKLGRDVALSQVTLLLGLEASPDLIPSRNGNLLCTMLFQFVFSFSS